MLRMSLKRISSIGSGAPVQLFFINEGASPLGGVVDRMGVVCCVEIGEIGVFDCGR